MKRKLTQGQRMIVAILYVVTIIVSYSILGGRIADILKQSEHASVWFFSGILLVIMGKYVTEPYFNSPTDTLSNSISLFLFLLTVVNKDELIGFYFLLVYSFTMFMLSIMNIVFKMFNEKFEKISFIILGSIGSSKCMFSAVYLLSAFSYFQRKLPMLVCSVTIWICLTFFDVYEMLLKYILSFIGVIKAKPSSEIGVAVRNNNDNIFHVEVSKERNDTEKIYKSRNMIFAIKTSPDTYGIAICVDTKMLLDTIWIELLLITKNGGYLTFNKGEANNFGILCVKEEKIGTTYIIDSNYINDVWINCINGSDEISKRERFIGFVLPDSNINIIKFRICSFENNKVSEGSIIETKVNGQNILYQVINGITGEENNQGNSLDGYMCAIARKLGIYNWEANELLAAKWTPNTNECVYLSEMSETANYQDIADTAIGHLPMTEMKIPIKDIDSLVTHNTAILGILGVGKSCLTFELIKKIVEAGIKVVCIDITNQYASQKGLLSYIDVEQIQDDLTEGVLRKLKSSSLKTGTQDSPESWGNLKMYVDKIETNILAFLTCKNKSVFVINPDKHIVKKAATNFKVVESTDVSLVEKTKIISDSLLKGCMSLGQTDVARCCLVFEEAHSLIPEWNSVVNSGDERHSNGTAKVILQGRKYGLGCILVTQRTANVIKSILNQCNTIFALRVFDDTGKSFLENYIGKDYTDVLPTLEERHAIGIGKGLKLRQPVIIQLNDAQFVQIKNANSEVVMTSESVMGSETLT